MPRPTKPASSKGNKKKTVANKCKTTTHAKQTIGIFDSDDEDFVVPNHSSRRVTLSEKSHQLDRVNDIFAETDDVSILKTDNNSSHPVPTELIDVADSVEEFEGFLSKYSDIVATNATELGFGRDSSNTQSISTLSLKTQKFNFKIKDGIIGAGGGVQYKRKIEVRDEGTHHAFDQPTKSRNDEIQTKNSWTELMQRMQNNQNTNSKLTSKKSLKLKNKWSIKLLKATKSSKSETICKEEGSPPKKLKLEFVDITMHKLDTKEEPSTSQSTSSVISEVTGCDITSATTSTQLKFPNVKIPNMFLKPAERAAIREAQKLEPTLSKVHFSEQDLEDLSTEPEVYDSVKETSETFDGNIVKLNDVVTENPYAGNKSKTCPFYKKLPGTRFSIDAFNYGLIPGIEVYFLSHFHSDHYMGLSKKFCKTLVCSPPTANLVQMKFNVDEHCIRRLQINKPYIIDDVEVTLINANHCPGSVMFIFKLANGITYFHTGDFRFTVNMLDNHILRDLRVDCLYLDTTYCDPQYNFPTQTAAIVELITVVKRKLELRPKTLIICGSYVIGKERVYLSLAEAIGAKVYMNYDKRRIIHALENPKYKSYLADKEDFASIHVQQMFGINPKFLSDYLSSRTSRYTNIIGVKPTGWQFSSSGNGSSIKSYYNDTVTIIGVPYSEHSSFSELEHFVRALKPSKVQPTVNVGSASKRESMMLHINKWLTT